MSKEYYRFRDILAEDGVKIVVEVFNALKETPQGYWVLKKGAPNWNGISTKYQRKAGVLKWISNTSRKKYCYPTVEDALFSFKKRKEAQASKLKVKLDQAEKVISSFDNFKDLPVDDFSWSYPYDGYNCGKIDAHENLIWD